MKPTTTTKSFLLPSAFRHDFEFSAMNLFHFSCHIIIALSFTCGDKELYLKEKRDLNSHSTRVKIY